MEKDGGPAFARAGSWDDDDLTWMVFPQEGMSLRDFFAGMALQGTMAALDSADKVRAVMHGDLSKPLRKGYVRFAWEVADAMLEERDGP